MQLIQSIGKKFIKKVPVITPGCTVRVHQRIKEGEKERVQIFEGLVIAVNSGNGPNKTFTVRKIVDGIGVEKIFPLYSKNITKINVTKKSNVRRSKLYYMRKRSGKSARLRETHLSEKDVQMEDFEEPVVEEAQTEETEVAEVAEETTEQVAPEAVEEKAPEAEEAAPEAEEPKAEAEEDKKAE